MLHIAIAEDNAADRDRLTEYLQRYGRETQQTLDFAVFASGLGLVTPYAGGYDVVFLDIEMPGLDGLETARRIRALDSDVALVFITNLEQYALKGYSVNATNFILKPVGYFALCEEMKSITARLESRTGRTLLLRTESGLRRVSLAEILCAETQGRRVVVHTDTGAWPCGGTLAALEAALDDPRFFRCHSSCLVNLYRIRSMDSTSLETDGGQVLPVSRHRKKQLEQALLERIGAII